MKLGLVVNPVAGIGGAAGLKGSDAPDTLTRAAAAGVTSRTAGRLAMLFDALSDDAGLLEFLVYPGPMGADYLNGREFGVTVVGELGDRVTTPDDTRRAVVTLQDQGVDLILFAGGDGTARDVCDVARPGQLVLGIPCGVKMQSGVFANHPVAAAEIIRDIAHGRLTTAETGEVRDIDEAGLGDGIVRSTWYGELNVPAEHRYVQQTKVGGRENEELAVAEIAAFVVEGMQPGVQYFIGPGSTTAAVMAALGLPNTLLGVDIVRDGELLAADVSEPQLFAAAAAPARLLVTLIGGQGHLFGRGNQQFSPRVIRAAGLDCIDVIATRSKLLTLAQRPMIVDTGDLELDRLLSGLRRVITGYDDAVLVRAVAVN